MKKKYFFVGIKGSGMSALAQVLADLGHEVEGSDVEMDFSTSHGLIERGIPVYPFNEQNILGDSHYIISTAYDELHPEVKKIKENNFPYQYYHEALNMVPGIHIAISGTHGKTTTTSLTAQVLQRKKIAMVSGDGTGFAQKNPKYFVYEACEYKNHFHVFKPQILVITNIEQDHPDFFSSAEEVIRAFQTVASQAEELIINGDFPNGRKIRHPKRTTFGFRPDNDYRIRLITQTKHGFTFLVNHQVYFIPFTGKHMIYNAAAAIIIGLKLGMRRDEIQAQLHFARLPKRRMQTHQVGNTVLIDDYAHHPTEILALHQALRQKYPGLKINVIFQPHTYSRTLAFKRQFAKALARFDEVYLEKVFASAREKENAELQTKINEYFRSFKVFTPFVLQKIDFSKKEVWVFLGAGIVNRWLEFLLKSNV